MPQASPLRFAWAIPLLLAAASGALVTLSLAPYHIWPAALVSLMALLALLHQATPRQAFWRGWCYGLGFFGSGISWVYVSIHVHGNAGILLATMLTALFCAALALLHGLQAWLWVRFLRRDSIATLAAFPALWVLFEWLRNWLLTGFPWLYIGYAPIDTALAGWAPVAGVFGVSLALALCASTAFLIMRRPALKTTVTVLLLPAVLWLLGWVLSHHAWTTPRSQHSIDVALIQPNIPLEKKWDRRYFPDIIADFRQQTLDHLDADLVLWPESAIPAFYQRVDSVLKPLATAAAQQQSSLILGIPYQRDDQHTRYYNSIVAEGNGSGAYFKQRLVPFGEYVPLESWLRGLITFFDLPMSHFSIGPPQQALLTAGQWQVAPYICYEIVYPDLVASTAKNADLLITISNDSWFGDSIGPLQHMQMARMRALENGRYLLRGTNNGITAIIDPKGNITAQVPQFEKTVLRGEATAFGGSTPFGRTGSAPIILLCFALLGTSFLRRRNNNRHNNL